MSRGRLAILTLVGCSFGRISDPQGRRRLATDSYNEAYGYVPQSWDWAAHVLYLTDSSHSLSAPPTVSKCLIWGNIA